MKTFIDDLGAQNSSDFSASAILDGIGKNLNVAIFLQNHYAHYSGIASALAARLSANGHQVTFVPLSWASSTANSHIRMRFPFPLLAPDDEAARVLKKHRDISVMNLRDNQSHSASRHHFHRAGSRMSLEEIGEISINGLPVGRAVRDEIIRRGSASGRAVTVTTNLVTTLIGNYQRIYSLVRDYLDASDPDLVVLFNGRFLPEAASHRAALDAGVPIAFYEAGGVLKKYDFYNHPTHDIAALSKRTWELFDQGCSREVISFLASAWFDPRLKGETPVLLPGSPPKLEQASISDADFDVVYFSSSSDELEFNVESGVEAKQRSRLTLLHQACRDRGLSLTVRTHPNMRLKSRQEQADWSAFLETLAGIRIISQNVNLDAYQLVKRSSMVVTFASTIGIESIYLGKPTLITGPAIYSDIPGLSKADSYEDIDAFLSNPVTTNRDTAIAYGAFQMVRGFDSEILDLNPRDTALLFGKTIGNPKTMKGIVSRSIWRFRNAIIVNLSIR